MELFALHLSALTLWEPINGARITLLKEKKNHLKNKIAFKKTNQNDMDQRLSRK